MSDERRQILELVCIAMVSVIAVTGPVIGNSIYWFLHRVKRK